MVRYWARRGLLGHGVVDGLAVECDDDGTIVRVEPGHAVAPDGSTILGGSDGLLLPGLVDHHSHAFHRALRGRAAGGDFWAWRVGMYELVDRLDPDTFLALTTAAYGELLLAGISTVHEFHYLHQPTGMDEAVVEAARRTGIRLVLLDTCYLRAGLHDDGAGLDHVQRRFSDGDVDSWAARADGIARANPAITVGAAIHSVRAVDPESMGAVAAWARDRQVPLHLHLSEQLAENEACVAATGRSPAALAADLDVLGPGTTVVHATNITAEDAALLGWSGTTVCLCPTTERDLADGIGPARALADAGCRLTVGTDSHAVVDLFEEARAIELDQRLATGRRGLHQPCELLDAATGGVAIEVGRNADLCAVDLDGRRLAGADPADPVPMLVAAATAADVTDTVVGGRHVVVAGRHAGVDVAADLRAAIRSGDGVSWDLLLTGIAGRGAVAVEGGRIAWSGPVDQLPASPATGAGVSCDVGGRLVTPGLVDCHTHLVFGGDRSAEWEQRLAGAGYEQLAAAGGGIRSTVAATRAATDGELLDGAVGRARALAAGGVTTIEVKSGYGLDLDTELRLLRTARRIAEEAPVHVVTTCLAAHAVPPELDGDADAYVRFVCDELLPAVAAQGLADAVDAFCERIAFTAVQVDEVFTAATRLGLRVKLHADQLSDGGGARLAARHRALSADHLEHASPDGIAALADAGTVAVLLPGAAYVLDDPAVPPVDALRTAGVPMAVATDCNPGTSPVLSLPLAMHLACTRFGLTVEEALAGTTVHAAAALGLAGEAGTLAAGARADLVVWDAEGPAEIPYWLGAPPVHAVVHDGRVVLGSLP